MTNYNKGEKRINRDYGVREETLIRHILRDMELGAVKTSDSGADQITMIIEQPTAEVIYKIDRITFNKINTHLKGVNKNETD